MKTFIKSIGSLNDRQILSKIIIHNGSFDRIASLDNLFSAWEEFRKGKRNKADVCLFESKLEDNIFDLYQEIGSGKPKKTIYQQFRIVDPKPRNISKASVAERLLHNAIYRVLQPVFDKTFIYDSYSCRKDKGTHKAFKRLYELALKVSHNYTRTCWALKCDIRKFFDSIDHNILIKLLEKRIEDKKLLLLLESIINSFNYSPGKGMPLGNLTSQLFVNLYLDPLDKFVKHRLKAKNYLRYTDDFILLCSDSDKLIGYIIEISAFLKNILNLELHPNKIILRKLNWGIDFVGYVALPNFNLVRNKTRKRMIKKLLRMVRRKDNKTNESLQSYLGHLKHVNAYKVSVELQKVVANREGI